MTIIPSVDPRTGEATPSSAEITRDADIDAIATAARDAAPALEAMGRAGRARMLRAMADRLEAAADELVATCERETALPEARLRGELARTAFQLRFFGEVLDDGAYLDVTIAHAGEGPLGPTPDLRLMNVPIGPVAVFAASNFPFAFSVGGGDVASALAAGCPVVVKAHSSHPQTSVETARALSAGIADAGGPAASLALVFGREAGIRLLEHPAIRAAGFTGSVAGGRALSERAAARPDPIPFFGELGSVNPLVVTPLAAERRGPRIGADLVDSFTLGTGQFCTKPGLVFVPADAAGDALVDAASAATSAAPGGHLLNEAVRDGYDAGTARLRAHPGARVVEGGAPGSGFAARPHLLVVDAADFTPALTEECFGPVAVLVRYPDLATLHGILATLPGALAGALHAEDDDPDAGGLLEALRPLAGRLIWNGYPTGVTVSWAMHHGGPWPSAADARQTSVGAGAIRRWLRPVSWQGVPEAHLPAELREAAPVPVRRVDGRLEVSPAG